jgi:predicted outer membrane protein
MTMKSLFAVALLSLFSLAAHAQDADSNSFSGPDIAKVINQTPDQGVCGIESRTLVYQDSKGETHTLNYLIQGSGCSDN